MPTLIPRPTRIEAAGNKPKIIEEFIGRASSKESRLSIARMKSPGGWVEPGQQPQFDESTVVLAGVLHVKSESGELEVRAGQAIVTPPASGCSIRRRARTAPNTSPCACRPSHRRPFTAMPLPTNRARGGDFGVGKKRRLARRVTSTVRSHRAT